MKSLYIAGLLILASPTAFAEVAGTCTTISGTHVLNLNFPQTSISAKDNVPGKTMVDIAEATASDSYQVNCSCDSKHRLNKGFSAIYYTADPTGGLVFDKKIGEVSYYNLNEYLDVGVKIFIKNVGYTAIPFEHVSNRSTASHTCGSSNDITLDTGTSSMLSFYIRKSITGLVTIPLTDVALVYGGISNDLPRGEAIAKVRIKGSIIASQQCEINDGQVINIDFGQIPASEFSATPGTSITSKKIEKTVTVSCSGLDRSQKVNADFNATAASADNTMVSTSNNNVGIKIYDTNGDPVMVNGGALKTEMGSTSIIGGKSNGTITFSAAPASATGARPTPGTFNADATITLEFSN